MARLNIEDDFWEDAMLLATKLGGDYDRAIGMAMRFLRVAQTRYKHGKIITFSEFEKNGFSEKLVPFFAKKTSDGYEAIGAEKHFIWLKKRVEAGAKGGKKPKPSVINNLALSKPKALGSKSKASLLSSLSSKEERIHSGGAEKQPPPDSKVLNKLIWESYKNSWAARYGSEPIRNATVNSQISSLAKRLGPDAEAVTKFYLTLEDPFVKKQLHPMGLLLSSAEGIWGQWKTGKKPGTSAGKKADLFGGIVHDL